MKKLYEPSFFLFIPLNLVKFIYICIRIGGLAQLARAFDWQSKGQRFDSAILHKKELQGIATLFCLSYFLK